MGLIYNFVWLGLSRMLQNIVVLMACKSFFHLHKCSAPSQSKATTLNEWFSTREVYLIRETGVIFAEKKKKKGTDREAALLTLLWSHNHKIQSRWFIWLKLSTYCNGCYMLYVYLCMHFSYLELSNMHLYTFFFFFLEKFTMHFYMNVGNS